MKCLAYRGSQTAPSTKGLGTPEGALKRIVRLYHHPITDIWLATLEEFHELARKTLGACRRSESSPQLGEDSQPSKPGACPANGRRA